MRNTVCIDKPAVRNCHAGNSKVVVEHFALLHVDRPRLVQTQFLQPELSQCHCEEAPHSVRIPNAVRILNAMRRLTPCTSSRICMPCASSRILTSCRKFWHFSIFQVEYPEIEEGTKPRHRFMSAYEQRVETADKNYQYLLFAAEPYEVVAFKVPNAEAVKQEGFFYSHW